MLPSLNIVGGLTKVLINIMRIKINLFWSVGCIIIALGLPMGAASSAENEEPMSLDFRVDEKELAPYKKKGTASIAGQAFLPTRGGEARYSPGGLVMLIPATPLVTAWFQKVASDRLSCRQALDQPAESQEAVCRSYLEKFLVPNDERMTPYVRVSRMDPTGHFWFTKLPPGRYYLTSLIIWSQVNGGVATGYVEIEAGERASNVIVSY